jgi:L-amino acid N-acyltransferase YncA
MSAVLQPLVRALEVEDLPAVSAIYGYAARHTDATLDEAGRNEDELVKWLSEHDKTYPAIGVDVDGGLAAYATLSPFAQRAGYLASAEISIYVDPFRQGDGLGRALCGHLTAHAQSVGFSTVLAVVTSSNQRSLNLFLSAGYEPVGTLRKIGYKLGHLVDLDILQRIFPANFARFDGRPMGDVFGSGVAQ